MKSVDLYRIYQIGILACTLNVYGQEGSKNVEQRVNSILSQMTLDEKISYTGGTLPRILKCLAEKPELQFASPNSTNRARKVIFQFKNTPKYSRKWLHHIQINLFAPLCRFGWIGYRGLTSIGWSFWVSASVGSWTVSRFS